MVVDPRDVGLNSRLDSGDCVIHRLTCVTVMFNHFARRADWLLTLFTVQFDDLVGVRRAEHECVDDDISRSDVIERHPVVASHQRQLVMERLASAAEITLTLHAAVSDVIRVALLALVDVTTLGHHAVVIQQL